MNPKFETITHDSFNVGIFKVRLLLFWSVGCTTHIATCATHIVLDESKTKLSPDKLSLGLAIMMNYVNLRKVIQ